MPLKQLSWEELLALFDESVHESIVKILDKDGVIGAVVFENLMLDSSQLGARTLVVYGPGCTYATVVDFKQNVPLGDLPSTFQYPQSYFEKVKSGGAVPSGSAAISIPPTASRM